MATEKHGTRIGQITPKPKPILSILAHWFEVQQVLLAQLLLKEALNRIGTSLVCPAALYGSLLKARNYEGMLSGTAQKPHVTPICFSIPTRS
jgi:hypothetical protein